MLAIRLAKVMEARIGSGNATDCSRLAWVLKQIGETERAIHIVERGLQLDPQGYRL